MSKLLTSRFPSGLLMALLLLSTLVACSGNEENNPMGATQPPMPMDEITVTFQSLNAILDCDGPDNPGDFHYSLNVDTLGPDGNYYSASSVGERSATLSNGVTRVAPFSINVTVPAVPSSEFRVRVRVREDDGATDDFIRTANILHVFVDRDDSWTGNWNDATRSGSQTWSLKLRSQETNWIGKITEEGCHFEVYYTVRANRIIQ